MMSLKKWALSSLYNVAKNGDFDIVHGTSTAGLFDLNGEFIPAKEKRYGIIFYGRLYDYEVFSGWLLKSQFTANSGVSLLLIAWKKAIIVKNNLLFSLFGFILVLCERLNF